MANCSRYSLKRDQLIRVVVRALTVCSIVCLSACLAVETYRVSDAVSASNEPAITKIGKFQVADTTVIVKPANAINTSSGLEMLGLPIDKRRVEDEQTYPIPFQYYQLDGGGVARDYFILEVLFVVKGDEVVFQPLQIALYADGQQHRPVGYFRLERRYRSFFGLSHVTPLCMAPGSYSSTPSNPLQGNEEINANTTLRLAMWADYCLAVKFKKPPLSPDMAFRIKLDGLIVNGKNTPVEILYQPGEYKGRHA